MLQTHMENAPSTILDLFNKNEKELSPKELSELKELKKASGLYRELYDGAMKAAEPTGENLTPEAAAADKQKAMGREVKKEAAQVDFSKYTSSDLERAIDIASAYEQQLSAYSKRAEAGYETNKDNAAVRDQWEQHIQEADKRSKASESIIQALMVEQQKREMAEAPAETRAIPSTAELAKAEIANIDEQKGKAEAGWPTAEAIQEQMKKDAVQFKEPKFDIDVVEPDLKQWDKEAKAEAGWPTAEAIQAEMKKDSVKFKEPKFDIDVVEPDLKQWDKEAKAEAGWPTAEAIQAEMKKDSTPKFVDVDVSDFGAKNEAVHPIEDINVLDSKPESTSNQEIAGWPTAEQIQKQMEADDKERILGEIDKAAARDQAPHMFTAEEKAWMAAGDKPHKKVAVDNFQDVVDAPMPKVEGVIYEEEALTPDSIKNLEDLLGAGLMSKREYQKALKNLESGNAQEKSRARESLERALELAETTKNISLRLLGSFSDILRDSAVFAAKVGMKAAGAASKIK